MTDSELHQVVKQILPTVKKAGEVVRGYFQSRYEIAMKGKENPVTTADLQANQVLKEGLMGGFPDFGWLSEETRDDEQRLEKEYVWIIDPLDGTKEFVTGLPEFVISVALVRSGRPVIGILYNPIQEELFLAYGDVCSTLNGEEIGCTTLSDLEESKVLISRTELKNGLWDSYQGRFGKLVSIGSVAYKLGLIAAGKADLFISLAPKNEWDICAGDLIVRNAGGRMSDRKGKEITYNKSEVFVPEGVVAGNPILFSKALQLFA